VFSPVYGLLWRGNFLEGNVSFHWSSEVSGLEFIPGEVGELVNSYGVGGFGWVSSDFLQVVNKNGVSVLGLGLGRVELSEFESELGELLSTGSRLGVLHGVEDGYSGSCES